MTKWQESCITALATSPIAWEAFKLKQRNRKVLDQYLNRIWPYHKVCEFGKINNIDVLLDALSLTDMRRFNFDTDILISNVENIDHDNISSMEMHVVRESNHYCQIYYEVIQQGRIKCDRDFDFHRNASFIRELMKVSISYPEAVIKIKKIRTCDGSNMRLVKFRILCDWLKHLRKLEIKPKVKLKSKKLVRKDLNVGIEIEYEGNETDASIKKKILNSNCASFDSGFDGDWNERLRENRIRLNGIKGLKGLWILLEDMNKKESLDVNSSVHMHIDCEYDNSYVKSIRMLGCRQICQKLRNGLVYNTFQKIFEIRTDIPIDRLVLINRFKPNSEFKTLEYRFCNVNLNYSDYVIQILTLIHLTECIKHECDLNERYLNLLLQVRDKLIKNTKSIT